MLLVFQGRHDPWSGAPRDLGVERVAPRHLCQLGAAENPSQTHSNTPKIAAILGTFPKIIKSGRNIGRFWLCLCGFSALCGSPCSKRFDPSWSCAQLRTKTLKSAWIRPRSKPAPWSMPTLSYSRILAYEKSRTGATGTGKATFHDASGGPLPVFPAALL